jgi:hypothetical protein
MWNVKAKVILVITGTSGIISKSLTQYLSNISGKREFKELKENSHIGHCTLTAGSADVKVMVKVKVKQYDYGPGQALRVAGG